MARTPLVRVAAGASLEVGGGVATHLLNLGLTTPQWLNTSSHSTAPSRCCTAASSSSWSTSRPLRQVGQVISLVPEALSLPSGEVTASTLMPLLAPSGEVPFNHEILREAYALCHCLPVLSTDKFKTDFYDVSARPRMGKWGSRALLHAGYDWLLSLHSNATMWGSWPTLAPSPRRATP